MGATRTGRLLRRLPWLGLVGAAIVSKELSQYAREFPLESGWLARLRDCYPNFAGVVCGAAGGMLFRPGFDADRWFRGSVAVATVVMLGWELSQLRTALVFDRLDLAASLIAAMLLTGLYALVRDPGPGRMGSRTAYDAPDAWAAPGSPK
ncbi:hypothetical protein ABI59_08775 [Acidobacteria bacterium Mor1]|nr:hypothetical protein ABI59_08775 [Acidobacteria bacterium Mor1]